MYVVLSNGTLSMSSIQNLPKLLSHGTLAGYNNCRTFQAAPHSTLPLCSPSKFFRLPHKWCCNEQSRDGANESFFGKNTRGRNDRSRWRAHSVLQHRTRWIHLFIARVSGSFPLAVHTASSSLSNTWHHPTSWFCQAN